MPQVQIERISRQPNNINNHLALIKESLGQTSSMNEEGVDSEYKPDTTYSSNENIYIQTPVVISQPKK